MKTFKAKLLNNENLALNIFKIQIECSELANIAKAGQFVNIKTSATNVPLLRRPFSISLVNPQKGWIEVLFQVVGTGTELLAKLKTGDDIDLIGPLGNHFNISKDCKQAILIAGGIGIAPLIFLENELSNQKIKTTLFWGNRTEDGFYCLEKFEKPDNKIFISTEDGTLGFKGNVVELLKYNQNLLNIENINIFACGPNPMLKGILDITRDMNAVCQFSLETIMACGIGACMGCNVKSNSSESIYKYVCKDGPVFYSNEINLSE